MKPLRHLTPKVIPSGRLRPKEGQDSGVGELMVPLGEASDIPALRTLVVLQELRRSRLDAGVGGLGWWPPPPVGVQGEGHLDGDRYLTDGGCVSVHNCFRLLFALSPCPDGPGFQSFNFLTPPIYSSRNFKCGW